MAQNDDMDRRSDRLDSSLENWLEKESRELSDIYEDVGVDASALEPEKAESPEPEAPVRPEITARHPVSSEPHAPSHLAPGQEEEDQAADGPAGEEPAGTDMDMEEAPAVEDMTAEEAPAPERRPAPRRVAVDPTQGASRRTGRSGRSPVDPPEDWESGYTPKKFWSGWHLALIPIGAALLAGLVMLIVSFSSASKVAKVTTIYPNVTVNGVNVGGMSVAEAAPLLGDDPHKYDDAAVTVSFPTGDELTVTAQDLGLKPVDGVVYAQQAYSYGRSGSMLANMKVYRSCKKKPVYLTYGDQAPQIDDRTLETLVAPVAAQVDEKAGATQAEIGQDAITMVKNLNGAKVDVAAVCSLIKQAFLTENYAPITYELSQPSDYEGGQGQAEKEPVDVDAMLQALYDEVFVEPVSAEYDKETNAATESVQGVRFDMDEAKRLWNEASIGQTVTIPLIKEDPEFTTEQINERIFADVLAEKSTSLSGSSSSRINNITLAAKAMNGTVLQPGEEFSYNSCLGQRTAAKGYQEAGVYSNGKHETAIGGGICQGSSTLYYCTLYANLKITERHNHMFLVSYLPRGLDATVSWGWPEFKFVNSRDWPIKIEAYVSNGSLTVRILGTDVDGSYVKMTTKEWQDSTYYWAESYRNVYDKNGQLISSTKEATSDYLIKEREDPTPTPKPTDPPETNDDSGDTTVVEPGPVIPDESGEDEEPAAPPVAVAPGPFEGEGEGNITESEE